MSYGTGQAVLEQVLSRGDEFGIGQADREPEAMKYIQAGIVSVTAEGFPWTWASVIDTPLRIFAPYTAGTATVAVDSATVTLSAAPAAGLGSFAGRKFYLDSEGVIYPVLSHTAGSTTVVLRTPYFGALTGGAFHLVRDTYDLQPDFLRPLAQSRGFLRDASGRQQGCALYGLDEVRTRFPYPGLPGIPTAASMVGPKTLVLGNAPSEDRLYLYDYIQHPTYNYPGHELAFDGGVNDVIPISPPEDGQVLEFFALAHLLNDRNDPRGRTFAEATVVKLADMKRLGLKLRKPRRWVGAAYRVSTPR